MFGRVAPVFGLVLWFLNQSMMLARSYLSHRIVNKVMPGLSNGNRNSRESVGGDDGVAVYFHVKSPAIGISAPRLNADAGDDTKNQWRGGGHWSIMSSGGSCGPSGCLVFVVSCSEAGNAGNDTK